MEKGPIVVVGSVVTDDLFRVEVLPFPGQTVTSRSLSRGLGGKGANQAVAARRLGAPVLFLGCVGDDAEGRAHGDDLRAEGVRLVLRVTAAVPTGRAAVVVDEEGENLICVHPGANAALSLEDLDGIGADLSAASVLVTQLEVPLEVVEAAARRAGENPETVTLLNAAPPAAGAGALLPLFDVAVLNAAEAEALAGVAIASLEDAFAALRAIHDLGVRQPVVTLGARGAVYLDEGRSAHAPAPVVEAVDATGAGDAFVGALAALLRAGEHLRDAVPAACGYAALATTKTGARAAYADAEAFAAWSGYGGDR
jgi:ribokinase